MARLREETHNGNKKYYFHCPGCDREHKINDSWDFNGDFQNPTINPSVLGRGKRPNENEEWVEWRCHSWITDGKIKFLNDSTHDLAGNTVELPEIE
ncbi:DUF6527 family protein [Fodinibius sp. SL11]|uniref:DUF6527 family protein n=1 Tax=Fodinibius sp. SL11 TaxID=3425690 RepID=UPI003F881903